jgi:3-hydroxybutyrate dehydrogenase
MSDLAGRVAIVTGAAGGLGLALCERLRGDGAEVLAVDLQGEDVFAADVGKAAGNQAMVDEALRLYGRIDILVLNAGIQYMAPIEEFPEQRWDDVMDVSVKGPYLATKAAWPSLLASGHGRIIVTASSCSHIAEPYKAAYVAGKHAVLGLVKVAALEGGPHGVTANAVAPGWMRTPLVEGQLEDQMRLNGLGREEVLATMLARQPVREFIEPAEVADMVAFLASERASAINGACVPIDHALLAW